MQAGRRDPDSPSGETRNGGAGSPGGPLDLLPAVLIDNLAAELLANRNLLAALAGPTIALNGRHRGRRAAGAAHREDLTRVLVKPGQRTPPKPMPSGGKILLSLRQRPAVADHPETPAADHRRQRPGHPAGDCWTASSRAGFQHPDGRLGKRGVAGRHRGLGLSISRSVIESAGGCIRAVNRTPSGARLGD